MTAVGSLIDELEGALRYSASDKRVETLRRITDLFLCNAERYDTEQVGVFDEVLDRLIDHIEAKTLAELGQRLAPIDNAPLKVIRKLASHDEIAVAGPVLTGSQRLTTPDLVNIALVKGQDHMLAISSRSRIDELVTDVLVERGNGEVARSVAGNAGARLSSRGFAGLVKRAEGDETLAERVGLRADIPPQLFQQLLNKATAAVQARLTAKLNQDAAQGLAAALGKVARDLPTGGPPRDYGAAQVAIGAMHRDKKLNELVLLEFVKANRFEETVVALSALSGASVELLDGVMQEGRIDALLIPCKAAGLSWHSAKSVMQLHPRYRTVADEAIENARKDFLKLSSATAQRILRFWLVRTGKGNTRSGAAAFG
jgi:uncharacterized protein (DUF2336 family)